MRRSPPAPAPPWRPSRGRRRGSTHGPRPQHAAGADGAAVVLGLPQRGQHSGEVVVLRQPQPGPESDRAARRTPRQVFITDHQHRHPVLDPVPARLEQAARPRRRHAVAVVGQGPGVQVGGDHGCTCTATSSAPGRPPAPRPCPRPQARGAADGRHDRRRRGAQDARPPASRRTAVAASRASSPRAAIPQGHPEEAPAAPADRRPSAAAPAAGIRRSRLGAAPEARPRLAPSPAVRGRPGSSRRCRRRRAARRTNRTAPLPCAVHDGLGRRDRAASSSWRRGRVEVRQAPRSGPGGPASRAGSGAGSGAAADGRMCVCRSNGSGGSSRRTAPSSALSCSSRRETASAWAVPRGRMRRR